MRILAAAFVLAIASPIPPVSIDGPGAEVLAVPTPHTPARCAERRARLAEAIGDGVLVVEAGEPADGRFHPDDDFRWLTGVGVAEAALVLVAKDGRATATALFLPKKSARYELWNGPRLGPGEEATAATGIEDTRELGDYEQALAELFPDGTNGWATGEAVEKWLKDGGRKVLGVRSLLRPLQAVREPEELAAQRAAIDVTQAALVDAFAVAVPGAFEFTAEAAIESGFRKRGASQLAFASICAAGKNACHLHYRENQERIEEGELLLLDVGAKFHGYSADVTRTIPAGGAFTPRQREVYDAVWAASVRAAATLKPGSNIGTAHQAAVDEFKERGFSNRDFPHSVGHGLGLRVHDAPSRGGALEPGMVVTIEPGLYLPDEAIGVRIENDWLITADGAELLTDDVPSAPDELLAFLAAVRAGGLESPPVGGR